MAYEPLRGLPSWPGGPHSLIGQVWAGSHNQSLFGCHTAHSTSIWGEEGGSEDIHVLSPHSFLMRHQCRGAVAFVSRR